MDFLQVIEKRKSVRKYSDRPVERELLDAIVKVAQTAPSSRNSKSSSFIIIEDKDTLEALSQMRDYGASPLKTAQAGIVVLGRFRIVFVQNGGTLRAHHLRLGVRAVQIGEQIPGICLAAL